MTCRYLAPPLFVAVLLLLSTLVTTVCADELVALRGGYQLLSPQGSIAGSASGIDRKIDVKRELDLDDSDSLTGEVSLQWGRTRLSLNYLPISFSGTGTLKASGSFNGQDFIADEEVKSDLDIALYDVGFAYYLVNLDDLPVRFQLGPEFSVKIADTEAMFRTFDSNINETASALVPIPTVGVRGRIGLADFFGISGRVGYMEVDSNYFLDAEAQLEFSPIPLVGLYAGYRYFDLKIDDSDIYVETDFSGPFAGMLVRF